MATICVPGRGAEEEAVAAVVVVEGGGVQIGQVLRGRLAGGRVSWSGGLGLGKELSSLLPSPAKGTSVILGARGSREGWERWWASRRSFREVLEMASLACIPSPVKGLVGEFSRCLWRVERSMTCPEGRITGSVMMSRVMGSTKLASMSSVAGKGFGGGGCGEPATA